MGSKRQICAQENAVINEYMEKYSTINAASLAKIIHADGELPHVSECAMVCNISRKRAAKKAAIMPKPEPPTPARSGDGEQIAITGTIAREELDALAEKARKYDYLIRAIFAGATESRKTPNTLYLNFPTVNEILNAFEPALYAEALRRH